MSVVADLNRAGLEVSMRQALENRTIRTLAEAIAEAARSTTPPAVAREYLVRLNEGTGGPALFVAHPMGGRVDCYAELARGLRGVCTVYGIQAPFNSRQDFSFDTLQQLARAYVDGIRAVQPSGPYHVAGWSAGGTLAYAIAGLLEASGERVEYLGLFEGPPPGVLVELRSDFDYLIASAKYADPTIHAKLEGVELPQDFEAALKVLAALIIEDESRSRISRRDLETALRFGVTLFRTHASAPLVHLSIHGTTTLYQAVDEKRNCVPADQVEKLLDSPLRTVVVAGDHAHLMTGNGLADIVADLREELSTLFAGGPALEVF
jgi:thioesterase domain-containing protein